ncbi:PREDICTED: uncharacterized protein LOC106816578 [Priapulus caudatus]|uniref:Uncharacterized protein LOC106816578 n=1 Tax=Priapulus caudatus TaxID=37621 RepID=A0ABM1EWW7_PRICU|nr:PREDICTED: uncharacterized protein LOC106816578 [Priapulus caudatus]
MCSALLCRCCPAVWASRTSTFSRLCRIDWLGNFRVVLSYNVLFAGATVLCLVTTFTATVRRELYVRLGFEHISRLKHEQWVRLPFNRLHDLGAKSMRSMAATTDLKLD